MKTEREDIEEEVVLSAKRARQNAYAPYSQYRVGAAILTGDGRIYAGCNFENASYGACICAERSAVGAMVADGARSPVLCVVVTEGEEPATPCGICRQVLAEFAPALRILLVAEWPAGEKRRETSLDILLPERFRLESRPLAR